MRKHWRLIVVLLLLVGGTLYTCVAYYSFVFAKMVSGEIIAVERVNGNNTILTGQTVNPAAMFSFAVAIRKPTGEIFTASSEDRQWAIAQKGQCAEAKFFPYPPWDLESADTYFNARLIKLYDCPKK